MELLLVCQLDLDQSGLLSYNFNTYDCRYVIEKKRFPECGSKDEQVGWFIGYFPLCSTRTNSQQALQPQPQLVARFQAFQESAFTAGGAWSISCFSTGGWCLQSCPGSCTACGWSQCLGRDFGVNLESNQDSKFWVIKDCCILKFIQASLNQNWFLH